MQDEPTGQLLPDFKVYKLYISISCSVRNARLERSSKEIAREILRVGGWE